MLATGPAANGGSCVARHDGRGVSSERGSYWHAETIEVLEASPDRIDPLCPVAGPDGAGCCDLAFADPAAVRALKGQVVANQLARLGDHEWAGEAEPVGDGDPQGWRTRVRFAVSPDGRGAPVQAPDKTAMSTPHSSPRRTAGP